MRRKINKEVWNETCLGVRLSQSTRTWRRNRDSGRKTNRLCTRCGVQLADDAKTFSCSACIAQCRALNKKRYDRRKKAGKCVECNRPGLLGGILCVKHNQITRRLPAIEQDRAEQAAKEFDGLCQCCGCDDPGGKGTWHIDHDHTGNTFRGIICASCNQTIGCSREDAKRLRDCAGYLESTIILKDTQVLCLDDSYDTRLMAAGV
jgi:hypothetical protein